MPIYEYKCLNCGNQLEIMQKISEEPLRECPRCQGRLEKQWSLSGFQFKGTGWYVSDYTNRGNADSKTETKQEGESKTKKENKEANSNASEKTSDVASTSGATESTTASPSASKTEGKSSEIKSSTKTD